MAVFPTGAVHRPSNNYVWDVNTMAWVVMTQPSGSGGGGAATIADGADVAEGSTTDAAVITDTTGTVSGKLRGLVKHAYERMPAALGQTTMAASLPVTLANNQSALPVTGIFFQATQPVSAVSLPLPTGAATSALQTQVTPSLNTGVRDAGTQRVTIATNDSVPVTGAFFQATQPVSGTVAVSNFPATQPVSGSVTVANAAGASAVNIQDGGNSITVDGAITGTAVSTSRSDTYTVPANGVTISAVANPFKAYAVQVVGQGTLASLWDVRLEGSLDNVNFDQILQHTNTTGDAKVVFSGALLAPSLYVRSRCAGLTLGTATGIAVTIVGVQ